MISDSLTHTVNFGIGSAYSEDSGSAFSEGPGPGPGPLYKVCPVELVIKSFITLINVKHMIKKQSV